MRIFTAFSAESSKLFAMGPALLRTLTEILDSKKAAYSFLATAITIVLHLKFNVSIEDALLLVSPLGIATAAQAHVDAKLAASSLTKPTGAIDGQQAVTLPISGS
jgi:hypothetical protein